MELGTHQAQVYQCGTVQVMNLDTIINRPNVWPEVKSSAVASRERLPTVTWQKYPGNCAPRGRRELAESR